MASNQLGVADFEYEFASRIRRSRSVPFAQRPEGKGRVGKGREE
ncbi:hypothetical protein [Nodularia spumigena]|nr:hypothetical protein [Nodularia spumigena]MDB9359982.1 hypothetical protein [Nodularia spumigena CS-588/02]